MRLISQNILTAVKSDKKEPKTLIVVITGYFVTCKLFEKKTFLIIFQVMEATT